MPKQPPQTTPEQHPAIARWLAVHGTIEFGYCPYTRSAVRVLDAGGLVWQGRRSYRSFAAALTDCEANISRLLREEYNEH